ncbi:MarR family winged helix-turn-helix transcriptional regulator, partial [Methylocaldum sp.]|uniref:MarR family winged helix-turn-helix transcriptional regulator n=2 Tax=Methylocaldum TaxID=73778 RepID=UPI00321FA33B
APSSEMPDYRCCMDCTGFNLRKATRAVSQLYDEMLRPAGIRGTQYSLLVAVHMSGPITVTQLAENAVMDRTTLSRNLELLENQGLIDVASGEDRRTRMVTITDEGRVVLLKAYPLWEQAQSRIREAMGEDRLQILMRSLSDLIEASQAQ